jgi:Right handed beta helix region
MGMVPRLLAAAVMTAALLLGAAVPPAGAVVVPACTLYASPGQSVQQLVDRLGPGQTGCLAAGVYTGNVVIRKGGTATARVTLRALTPRSATIRGQLRVDQTANFVTVSDLVLDGTNPEIKPSPLVNGDDARFLRNDVSSDVESCFVLGDKVWGVADRTLIANNHIHHCGVDGTNQDQGVYVRQARATRIENNVIRANPDRGVQLFPNADDTLVRGNVIDGNGSGVIFSGDSVDTADRNVVERNIIVRSDLRWNVESYWWNGNVGSGNAVRDNCVWGGIRGNIQSPQVGFTTARNIVADPRLTLSGLTYRLASGTPCPVKPPVLW